MNEVERSEAARKLGLVPQYNYIQSISVGTGEVSVRRVFSGEYRPMTLKELIENIDRRSN